MAIKSLPLEGKLASWIQKLEDLRELQAGWDGYDAPRPDKKALENVRAFLDALKLLEDLEIALLSASAVGGVGITFAVPGREAYVEFYNDGRVFTILSTGHEEPRITEWKKDTFSEALKSIRDYIHG